MGIKVPKEGDLVKACLTWLNLNGILAWRQNSGGLHVRGHYYRFNGEPGMSDIVGILPLGEVGVFLAVEVKRPGARTAARRRLEQESFREQVRRFGGVSLVVTSLQELEAGLLAEGWRR